MNTWPSRSFRPEKCSARNVWRFKYPALQQLRARPVPARRGGSLRGPGNGRAGAAVPCIVPCISGIRARPCPDGRAPGHGRAGAAVPRLFGASRAVPRGASEVATTSTPHTPHRVRPCVRTPAWRPKSKFGFSYESHKYHYRARLGHIILRTRRVSGALH